MPGIIRETDLSQGSDQPPSLPIQASPNVFADNIPVVRVGDQYAPHPNTNQPHPGRTASQGSPNVFANNLAVQRAGDAISCGDSANGTGSPDVIIN